MTGLDTRVTAIARSLSLGRKLQQEIPQLAEDYRAGTKLLDIVSKYEITGRYGVTSSVARAGVGIAIRGYAGGKHVPAFDGLVPRDEFERLDRERRSVNGKKGGRATYERKIGLFAPPGLERIIPEQHRQGKYLLSEEASSAARIRGGIAAAISRGNTLWSETELQCAYGLSQDPGYQVIGGVNNTKIAVELNSRFHEERNIRNNRSAGIMLRKYVRRLLHEQEMIERAS